MNKLLAIKIRIFYQKNNGLNRLLLKVLPEKSFRTFLHFGGRCHLFQTFDEKTKLTTHTNTLADIFIIVFFIHCFSVLSVFSFESLRR